MSSQSPFGDQPGPLHLPVALLAAIDTNLSKEHGCEKTNVPRDQVKPEGRVKRRTGGEVCKLFADLGIEKPEQRVAIESADRD